MIVIIILSSFYRSSSVRFRSFDNLFHACLEFFVLLCLRFPRVVAAKVFSLWCRCISCFRYSCLILVRRNGSFLAPSWIRPFLKPRPVVLKSTQWCRGEDATTYTSTYLPRNANTEPPAHAAWPPALFSVMSSSWISVRPEPTLAIGTWEPEGGKKE